MLTAIGLGALAAGSLVIGALLAFARTWPRAQIGLVLAFGAGALTYYLLDGAIEQRFAEAGTALALGAFLDGIPEQLVLGSRSAAASRSASA